MKKVIVIAVMFAVLAGTVYSQAIGTSIIGTSSWESPQSASTAGRMRSAADDFIRPDSYTSASVGDWFAMTSFADTLKVNLGYAKKLENLYLAAYYSGRFGNALPVDNYREGTVNWRGNNDVTKPVITNNTNDPQGLGGFGGYSVIGFSTSTAAATQAALRPDNNAAILIGVADMGFRLAFYSTYETFKKEDFVYTNTYTSGGGGTDTTLVKSFVEEGGIIVPQLAWSLTKNLTSIGIKPYLTVDIGFYKSYKAYEEYDGGAPNYEAGGLRIDDSRNYVQPQFSLGLGGVTVASEGGFSATADLDYVLRIRGYENEYSYIDGVTGNYKTKTIAGIYREGGLTDDVTGVNVTGRSGSAYQEKAYVYNEFTPSLSGSWSKDKLRLRFKLNFPIRITNEDTTNLALQQVDDGAGGLVDNTNGTLVKQGADQSATTVAFVPNLRLAARWQATSNLFLNIGGRIDIASVTGTTTEGETYNNGTKNTNSAFKSVSETFGATSNQLYLGATFSPTTNFTVEATTGVSDTNSNNIDVFETTTDRGLFVFGSILVSVKF